MLVINWSIFTGFPWPCISCLETTHYYIIAYILVQYVDFVIEELYDAIQGDSWNRKCFPLSKHLVSLTMFVGDPQFMFFPLYSYFIFHMSYLLDCCMIRIVSCLILFPKTGTLLFPHAPFFIHCHIDSCNLHLSKLLGVLLLDR